jgi:hypothetical protein
MPFAIGQTVKFVTEKSLADFELDLLNSDAVTLRPVERRDGIIAAYGGAGGGTGTGEPNHAEKTCRRPLCAPQIRHERTRNATRGVDERIQM